MNKKARIAIDFDGVIYSYRNGYIADELPDPPVNGAFEFIENCLSSGYDVSIFSTRCKNQTIVNMMINWMKKFGFNKDLLDELEFTNVKPIAKIYLDDRGFRFDGMFPTIQEIDDFEPWHKGKSSSVKEYSKQISFNF